MQNEIKKYLDMPFKERMIAMKDIDPVIRNEVFVELKLKRKQAEKDAWMNMPDIKDIYDVPKLPIPLERFYVDKLVECGAIAKKDLVVGVEYEGRCRNATFAKWDGEVFWYLRNKFNQKFQEKINHFEDDNGADLFVPIKIKKL